MESEQHQKTGMSPVSVVGFTCESSSDLTSPRCAASRASSSSSNQVSLLSILLSSTQQNSAGARGSSGNAAEDCYDDDEDDVYDEDMDEAEERGQCGSWGREHGAGLPGPDIAPAPLRRAKTAPMEVPTAIYLRDPLAKTQLQQMHYERVRRREQLEAMLQQQAELHRAACPPQYPAHVAAAH